MSDQLLPGLFIFLSRLRRALPFVTVVLLIGLLVTTASYLWGPFGLWVSEPRVDGAVIDKVTRKPIEGAIIAGYYVTTRTTGHGRKPVRYPKLFEAVTDSNGRFTIPSWKSDAIFTPGWQDNDFLHVLVYKPGYQLAIGNGGKGMRDWRMSDAAYTAGALDNMRNDQGETVIDWTKQPAELVPARNDYDRFVALTDSGLAYGGGGEPCAWESYPRLMEVAQVEYKLLVGRNVPSEHLDARGYMTNSGYFHPDLQLRARIYGVGGVDGLFDAYQQTMAKNPNSWRCKPPSVVFSATKR